MAVRWKWVREGGVTRHGENGRDVSTVVRREIGSDNDSTDGLKAVGMDGA